MASSGEIATFKRRSEKTQRISSHFDGVLGTSLDLQLVGTANLAETEELVLAEIERLDAIFSGYREDSEFALWQKTEGTAQPISKELAAVLHTAEVWRQKTNSAFSPLAASGVVNVSKPLWEVDLNSNTAMRQAALPISLDAIAKGFIVDSCAELAFLQNGVQEIVVNIGGDIRHLGKQSLKVGITDPHHDGENSPVIDTVSFCNGGIATSGNYRRRSAMGSHIIDPRTGLPAEHIASASVIAPSAMIADILSTAISVLSPEESQKFVATMEDVAYLLVLASGERIESESWYSFRFKS